MKNFIILKRLLRSSHGFEFPGEVDDDSGETEYRQARNVGHVWWQGLGLRQRVL